MSMNDDPKPTPGATQGEPADRGDTRPRLVRPAETDADVERAMSAMSRRSFLWGAAGVTVGFSGWRWLIHQRALGDVTWPFRLALEANENLARDYFSSARLAPEFPRDRARMPKDNGDYGLSDEFDPSTWKLHVIGLEDMSGAETPASHAGAATEDQKKTADKKSGAKQTGDKKGGHPASSSTGSSSSGDQSDSSDSSDQSASSDNSDNSSMSMPAVMLTLADIKALPVVEMVTELKCIEGWAVIVAWKGARFADFVAKYRPAKIDDHLPAYVGMETPDGGYYVGLDMESAMHPQTLLCYEMNGAPLELEHGAPLRLVIPVKYGIKHIKCIGVIRFTDERPKDYWAELGYDWYAGH